jgi:hypothetical protein
MNKKISIIVAASILALGMGSYFVYSYYSKDAGTTPDPVITPITTSITYTNTEYGFNFTLPAQWQGYSIVTNTWSGNALTNTVASSGPKLSIRNPKWTAAAAYEDLPILIFTISQWNSYRAGNFSIGAAPIQASELTRNNRYVFALPARWDFDYSLGYKEAQDIMAGNPVHAFDLGAAGAAQGKLNTDLVCEQATAYMRFMDARSAATFVADCKQGKHPEVIEKYKADLNLGNGAQI